MKALFIIKIAEMFLLHKKVFCEKTDNLPTKSYPKGSKSINIFTAIHRYKGNL